jgi:purine-binding chemotaxis protein CheW
MTAVSVLPFVLGGQRFALTLDSVLRVLPALTVMPLPGAPATVTGLVNLSGRPVPVIDLARRFGWAATPRTLWQPFVLAKSSRRQLLLPVESVEPVMSCPAEDFAPAPDPTVPSDWLKGVVRTATGMLLIQDVERLLSSADEQTLTAALASQEASRDVPR